MSKQSHGWLKVNLGEVTTESRQHNDGSFGRDEVYGVTNSRGMIPMKERVRGKTLERYKVVRAGNFAYNPMRLNIGSIARWNGPTPVVVSPDYVVFSTDQNQLDSMFLDYTRQSARWAEYARTAGAGSVRTRIYYRDLSHFTFLLPPLAEQRKIAAILSSVDEVIQKTEAVVEQLQVVKKAMMQELLARGLPGRHTRFKRTEIGEIPEKWDVALLGTLASVFNGRALGTGGSWLRVFKTKHVYDGPLRLDQPEFACDDSAAKVPTHTYLQAGDTLTPNMAHGTIGRVAFAKCVERCYATDGQVMVLRTLDPDKLDSRFLFEYMSSERGRRRLLDCEKGSIFDEKRGQTHIYPTDVKMIPIGAPPVEEQRLIAQALAAFDAPLEENARCIANLREVKLGLMQRLLAGELRVTPDENSA